MKHKKPQIILPNPISPIVGFILQKDVYTTNLLYANDQFSTKSLRKTIPFHKPIWMINTNPNSCITILKENNPNLENNNTIEIEKRLLLKPKKLRNRKLKFPLPKMKAVPLSYSILQNEICKENIKIKDLKDDFNISSALGRNIKYYLKWKTNRNINKNDFSDSFNNIYKTHNSIKLKITDENEKNKNNTPLKTFFGNTKTIYKRTIKFDKIHHKPGVKNIPNKSLNELRKDIYQINDDLKRINLKEKERKKLFCKKDFFTTQIYTKINMRIKAK